MKKKEVRCWYCKGTASLQPDSVVFGEHARGVQLYVCDRYPACDSYVGVHRNSQHPLGTLANKQLRWKRKRAHEVFDVLWTSSLMSKTQAYKWMQARLSLAPAQAHIGKFSVHMCDMLITECEAFLAGAQLAA